MSLNIVLIIMFFILIGVLTIYSYYHIGQMIPAHKQKKKITIGIVILLYAFLIWSRLARGIFIITCMLFIIFDSINILLRYCPTIKKYWNTLYQRGISVIVLSLLVSIYGIYNVQNIVVTTYDIVVSKEIENKTIVVAADMHLSTTVGKEELNTFVKVTKEQQPDMIFLVGDIYDEGSREEDVMYSYEVFEELIEIAPIYFVTGNHEESMGIGGRYEEKEITEKLKEIGINVLYDEVIELEDMYIIGREDRMATGRKDIHDLVEGLTKDKTWIVLDHQPVQYQENKKVGVDVIISGHTHGGQIFPIGELDRIFNINDLHYGYKNIEEDFHAIVSSGMGTWGFPMRTSKHSEIVVLNIYN